MLAFQNPPGIDSNRISNPTIPDDLKVIQQRPLWISSLLSSLYPSGSFVSNFKGCTTGLEIWKYLQQDLGFHATGILYCSMCYFLRLISVLSTCWVALCLMSRSIQSWDLFWVKDLVTRDAFPIVSYLASSFIPAQSEWKLVVKWPNQNNSTLPGLWIFMNNNTRWRAASSVTADGWITFFLIWHVYVFSCLIINTQGKFYPK